MTFDTIAFTQDELDNALNLCCTSIGLCDNNFILPQIAGVTYISIGEISAKAKIQKRRYEKAQHKLYRICTAICTTDMRTFYFGFFLYNIIYNIISI